MNLSKCQERLSQTGLGVFIHSFPLLAVMSKTRTSRTVRDALTDFPRLSSNRKNAKSTAVRGARWARRTVRQDPADHPRVGRGLTPGPPELHTVLSGFEVKFGRSTLDPWTVRPEAIFLEKLCQKTQILNRTQRPADRPPQRARTVHPTG
jgi:hypothetical protein